MSSLRAQDGSIVVEIADSGVGMRSTSSPTPTGG